MSVRNRIVFLGDFVLLKASTDANGYPRLIANDYASKADVLVRGYPFGFCTHWMQFFKDDVIDHLLPSRQPTLWILAWGVSDMVIRPDCKEPCVELERFGENLRRLVETIKSRDPMGKIILVSPLPVDRDRWQRQQDCGDSQAEQGFDFLQYERCVGYIKKAVYIGFKHSLPALDLLLQVQDWRAMLAEDGCRLNDVGNNEMYKGITDMIESNLPDWEPSAILGDHVEFDPLRPPPGSQAENDNDR